MDTIARFALASAFAACVGYVGFGCGGRAGDPSAGATDGAGSFGGGPVVPPAVIAPAPDAPENLASVGAPAAIALDEAQDLVVFTTRETIVQGELVSAGALFVRSTNVPPALMIDIDHEGRGFGALATDGDAAYVATSDGRVVSVPLAGGVEVTLATLAQPATVLATAGDYVYFADAIGALGRVAKAGGDPEPLATLDGAARGVAADADDVYAATASGISRVDLASGEEKTIAAATSTCAMIRAGERLFWTAAGDGPTGATGPIGQVQRASVDGSDVATVASGAFAACAIAVDADSLWFATARTKGEIGAAGLMRARLAGAEEPGAAPSVVPGAANALAEPGTVAVSASHVYWLTDDSVMRLTK